VTTRTYCEIDPFCQRVLRAKMESGDLHSAPIWSDVKTLTATALAQQGIHDIDIITAGFPCQNISSHGNQKGLAGDRSGLFFEVARLADELRPQFLFLENVARIHRNGLRAVLGTLADIGYDARWITLRADEVGCPQPRSRWFLLANLVRERCDVGVRHREEGQICLDSKRDSAALHGVGALDILVPREVGADHSFGEVVLPEGDRSLPLPSWEAEPPVLRVAHGVPYQVDRVRALGNAVVPAQARYAFEMLSGIKAF